mmetsp:Transcript_78237/g.239272  ORF Transcript_78237/g.239272 Transcript_78237/m.239272 type:complete len:301 (-) Transcript_78237:235-1137(-)
MLLNSSFAAPCAAAVLLRKVFIKGVNWPSAAVTASFTCSMTSGAGVEFSTINASANSAIRAFSRSSGSSRSFNSLVSCLALAAATRCCLTLAIGRNFWFILPKDTRNAPKSFTAFSRTALLAKPFTNTAFFELSVKPSLTSSRLACTSPCASSMCFWTCSESSPKLCTNSQAASMVTDNRSTDSSATWTFSVASVTVSFHSFLSFGRAPASTEANWASASPAASALWLLPPAVSSSASASCCSAVGVTLNWRRTTPWTGIFQPVFGGLGAFPAARAHCTSPPTLSPKYQPSNSPPSRASQ